MPDLAVILVSWNTRVLILNALRALHEDIAENGPANTEIWVIDNASTDETVPSIQQQFPTVRVIASKDNLGFGKANNLVMREIGFERGKPIEQLPKAVYLLNPDTLTHAGATKTLYETLLSIPDAGVAGARLTYEDGSFQHSAFEFPGLMQLWFDLMPAPQRLYNTRWNGRYAEIFYQRLHPFPVGHTLGATMMLRREVIQQVGMFDEDFFLYAEEVDWSWRIQKAGWRIYCVPTAHVTHLSGQSTQQVKPQSVLNLWENRVRLFQKHYSLPKRLVARQIIRLGMRRKIRQTRKDYQVHRISAKERDALIEAYQKVMRS